MPMLMNHMQLMMITYCLNHNQIIEDLTGQLKQTQLLEQKERLVKHLFGLIRINNIQYLPSHHSVQLYTLNCMYYFGIL